MTGEVIEQLLVAVAMLALLLLPFYWNHALGVATIMRRSGRLNDGELGLAEIQLLPGWNGTAIPNSTASIQATDRLRRRFLAVFSESREDFTGEMNLTQFSQATFGRLCGSARVIEIQEPEPRTVGRLPALQRESVFIVGNRYLVKYLHTAIAGERGFHQVVVWAAPSAYDRKLFDRLIDGFRERPGPKPVPAVLPPGDTSRYDVH